MRFKQALALCIIIGLLLRLALIAASGWRMDYDEATVGLLGLRVLRGEFVTYLPAQHSLGAFEAYLLAPLFALLGANAVTFRIVGLAFSALYILTSGLLARQAFDDRAGLIAAMLAAFAPPYMLVVGLKTWGATIETLVFGNVLFLLLTSTIENATSDHQRRKYMTAAGLVAGLMFWLAWLGFYYFVPTGLLIVATRQGRKALRVGWWAALAGFFVGSAPFWIHNLGTGFPTIAAAFSDAPLSFEERRAVFAHFRIILFPQIVTGDAHWSIYDGVSQSSVVLLYILGLASLIGSPLNLLPQVQRRGQNLRLLLAAFVITVPALYLLSNYGRRALNPWGIDATGRYLLLLHTALPIGIAAFVIIIRRTQRLRALSRLAYAIPALVIGGNLLGAAQLNPIRAFDSPYYDRQPETLTPLIEFLDANQIAHVWTDAGIGHVLMFETNERILAADYYDARVIANGFLRFPDVFNEVMAADRVAFVVPILPAQDAPPIQQALDAASIEYTRTDITSTLAVFVPAERFDPALIAAGLGYQY